MLRKKIIKKFFISLSCLFIIGIIYLFPNKNEIDNNSIYNNKDTNIIYLIDNNNYISRVSTILTSEKKLDKVKEIFDILKIESNKHIRDGFYKIIPKSTKLLGCSLDKNLLKLNFNENILDVKKDDEEKLIEVLIYSMTEIDGIKNISVYVNGKILTELPKSKIKLDTILDRSFGINKDFNITTINQVSKATIYYLSKYNDYYYYVPVTKYFNSDISKIEVIIKELTSSKMLSTNLISYLNSKTELLSYNETDKTLLLNFNESILEDINSNNILEEVTYSINLSIKDNYDIEEVLYYVNDKIVSTFSLK